MPFEDYQIKNIIGTGITSKVYFAQCKLSKDKVAIKVITQKSKSILQFIKNEQEILKKIQSKHVVKLIQNFYYNNQIYLVLEYCDGGNLNQYILSKPQKKLRQSQAIGFIKQIILAFIAMYEIKCFHRDIKPENILIHKGQIKIADFGGSKCLNNYQKQLRQTYFGSYEYMSPQRRKQQSYGYKADIWSLGCVFFKMLTGSEYKIELGTKIFDQFTNRIVKQFLQKTLQTNPEKRFSLKQLVQFKFSPRSYIQLYTDFKNNQILFQKDVESQLSTQIQQIVEEQPAKNLKILHKIRRLYQIQLESILTPFRYLCDTIQLLDKANYNIRVYFLAIIKYTKLKINQFINQLKQKKNVFNFQYFDLFLKSDIYFQTLTNLQKTETSIQINFDEFMQSLADIASDSKRLQSLRSRFLNNQINKEQLTDFQIKIQVQSFKNKDDKIRILLSKLIILRLVSEINMSIYAYEQQFDRLKSQNIQNLKLLVQKNRNEAYAKIFNS